MLWLDDTEFIQQTFPWMVQVEEALSVAESHGCGIFTNTTEKCLQKSSKKKES